MPTLTAIYIYPIKSMSGIELTQASAELRGLQYDRRWMLVDEDGRFLSQREIPALVRMKPVLSATHLTITFDEEQINMDLQPNIKDMPAIRVTVWGDTLTARCYADSVNQWFSERLEHNVRLVYMSDRDSRPVDPRYATDDQEVSFADGYPYLLISEASLELLNSKLEAPLPMNRFRPNFVVSGLAPHEEDVWSDFVIGNVHFRGVKPCARCIITTTDQESGLRAAEPLRTLATYRNINKKILFGQNVIKINSADVQHSELVKKGDIVTQMS